MLPGQSSQTQSGLPEAHDRRWRSPVDPKDLCDRAHMVYDRARVWRGHNRERYLVSAPVDRWHRVLAWQA